MTAIGPAPSEATIFLYNVGFGDCLLLRLGYARGRTRSVLIDFGSTRRAKQGGPKSMEDVARKIEEHSAGKLDVVVATHRHRDHISGFAGDSGKIIASLDPEVVVQPWTEQPDLAVDATDSTVPVGGSTRLEPSRKILSRSS